MTALIQRPASLMLLHRGHTITTIFLFIPLLNIHRVPKLADATSITSFTLKTILVVLDSEFLVLDILMKSL